jgi:hypothetical protein
LIPAREPLTRGAPNGVIESNNQREGEQDMGIIFIVVAIAVAVVGIMAMAVAEPYEGNELYRRYT